MNFIRKIFNLISHKHEQLDEIKQLEAKLTERYNGDLTLALSQAENGFESKEELDLIKSKKQIEDSVKEYMTIFNMYK